ncbi:ankyrin repeat and LEM domain-containing protein 1 [Trichomycterus rosablanca]|uniref:ankyrin repeat and LEM domain-containing protein 1 n=1 Tax=Trichomycterus rosablanca TaxID=2290929 RepID=UPI002F360584
MEGKRNKADLSALLYTAVSNTDVRTAEGLLQRGADPNLLFADGLAAVHMAAGKESEKGLRCLKFLLQHKADPNLRTSEDLTPLHIAAVWGCYQNLKLLLENGGDPRLKDQGGNKAWDLAEQEENSKCAGVLQQYESQAPQSQYEDLPKFQYSLYRGRSMRDCGVNLSLMSDLGDAPLSSTRYSSFYRRSDGPGPRGPPEPHDSWLSDVSLQNGRESDAFTRGESRPPALSSTRLSGLEFQNHPDGACSRRSRKSVTFRDADEYFPHLLTGESGEVEDSAYSTVDFSLYPDFLHSDRVAALTQNQGIDVTSPDDVFVFRRDGEITEDFDKTVVGGVALDAEDDVFEETGMKDERVRTVAEVPVSVSSSSSGSSRYSSCDSETYKTTIEAPPPSAGIPEDQDGNAAPQVCDEGAASFTPSPFVTGRTRSRLSRLSDKTSTSSCSSSSLFEQTLPTPTRLRRNVAKSDPTGARRPNVGLSDLESDMSSLSVCSDVPGSQADTLIISGSVADTVMIPRSVEDSQDDVSVEDSQDDVFTDDKEFLTSDVSSKNDSVLTDDSSPNSSPTRAPTRAPRPSDNPSSGCTPRYSMSRICNTSRTQTLANLSCTPGGRPLLTDADEPVEYLYTDTEEGHELIETHVPPTSNTSLSTSLSTSHSDDTIIYDWRAVHTAGPPEERGKENRRPKQNEGLNASETDGLTDRQLRLKLQELGQEPGPINSHTRHLYVQKLRSLQRSPAPPKSPQEGTFTGYSAELNRVLSTFLLPDCKADEFALCEQFDQPDQNKRWREGLIKSSFNYLLLDPRVTKNLPYRGQSLSPQECFQTFITSIFYVGKGKRSRPYSHLYEALEYYRGDKTSRKLCVKVQHILQVWNCGLGVISLHCFQNVIPVEAYTREACMVDAIGLKMLTNQKRGDYYGMVSTWPAKRQRDLGVHLLYRAMQIFLAEGERQLRPVDIRAAR